jgi:uncharacterized metal-binding protein
MPSETHDFKAAVLPCNGIGRLVSTVVRLAAYRLLELRPDQVVLLSSGRLAVAEPEHVALLKKYPLLVIDGCRPRCASHMAQELGQSPAAAIYVADIAAEHKLGLSGEKRRGLTKKGMALVEAVAARAAQEVDRIIAEEMMSTL